ncbi:hypothetical protein AVT69_gp155 [Pseudomonas phage PhiPA3]|uniref:Uncharacterized protein 157 n=1 Tax=Pseudomonas phage PhiPA3 TaxID=998086 RepID=F8SK30_BPPA3|nr:hypothetical protein AVT69_gp155 [Pseudomonas phage PhiPA3]AEH03580.1 hypothetical protein [Pseudomonas phage PhiPA3]
MYKHYDPLTEAELETLLTLKDQVPFKIATSYKRRMGENGNKALSIYNYSKWFEWTKPQRELFKEGFSNDALDKAVQGWFLELPAGKGFLDRMTTWVDKPGSGTIIATALKDQDILLDDKSVHLKKGEQIGFHLSTIHQIAPSKEGQLWACIMVRGDHEKLT